MAHMLKWTPGAMQGKRFKTEKPGQIIKIWYEFSGYLKFVWAI
jgi:hypothetical protein